MAYETLSSLSEEQILELHRFYQNEWWTKDRSLADVRRVLQGSSFVVAFCEPESNRLIAFTRVLTDGVFKALIFDVIVAPEYRGNGIGHALIESVLAHPSIQNVRNVELYCRPELIPFYEQWGFRAGMPEVNFMRLVR